MAIEVNKLTNLNDVQLLYGDLRDRIEAKYTKPKGGIQLKDLNPDVLVSKANKENIVLTGTLSNGRKKNTEMGITSFAFGNNVIAAGDYSHAEGLNTKAMGDYSHASGINTIAGTQAFSIGYDTQALGEGSFAEGIETTAIGSYSHVEGMGTVAVGPYMHVFGTYNIQGDHFTYNGWVPNTQYEVGDRITYTEIIASQAITNQYICITANNDAQFNKNNWAADTHKTQYVEIVGNGSNKMNCSNARTLDWDGNETISNSLTIGTRNSSFLIGNRSFASGYQVSASGADAHVEGYESIASGSGAHAEGHYTQAIGLFSHAEGSGTQAIEMFSHTEGVSTTASGSSAHAEGDHTIAYGYNSHSQGSNTIANGESSHVFGRYNIADTYDNWEEGTIGKNYVVGDKIKKYNGGRWSGRICNTNHQYNEYNSNYWNVYHGMNYIEIVGNGLDENARSNARTLDWSGNESLAGSLTLGMGTANETTLTAQQTKAIIETSTYYYPNQYVITHGTGIWIQGGIHTNSGSGTSSTHNIHLDRYIDTNNIVKIVAAEGYKFLICGYEHSTNNFVGIYQPDGWLKTTSSDVTWYTSIDVATVGDYILDIMVANDDTSTDISPASLGNGISFYAKRIVSDKEMALYAAENKQLYNEHIWFKPGSISADGSDYTEGDADYRARTKASLPIYLDAKPNDKIYFSVLGNDMKIKVVQYNANGTVHSYINWATPEVAMIHVSGCYYRIAIQQASGGAGYHTAEASSFVRIYNYKKPIPNNAAKTNFCVMTYNVGQWYHGSGSVATYAELPTYENIQRAIIERYSPDILCTQEYTPYIHVLGNYFNNFYYYNPVDNDTYVGKMIASNYTQSESAGAVFTTTGSSYRNYAYSYMWLGGRRVCVISAHFIQKANDKTIAAAQLAELKTFADTQTYVIIGVDTNLDCTSTSDQIYIDNFKPWVDDGYHLANMDKFGFMNSIYRGDTWCCSDNIITSSNINIDYACIDNQKNITGIEQDHLPLVAYISFNQ